MILAVCNDPKILELVLMTKTAISLLQIIAPLGVVVFASIDIMKAVMAKDQDGINKQIKHIPKRLIAMAILFFVPTFVDLSMKVIDSSFDYTTCFTQASNENIESLYQSIVKEKIAYANVVMGEANWKSFDAERYTDEAKIALLNVKDEQVKQSLSAEVKALEEKIKQRKAEEKKASEEKTTLELDKDKYNPPDNSNPGGPNNPGGPSNPGTSPGSGSVPYYNQCDEPWGNTTFYTGTYCRQSCGATSLAMVVSGIGNNSNATPNVIGDKMKAMGLPATFVSHDAFTNSSFLSYFGIKGTRINGSNKTTVLNKFTEVLNNGSPIIINLPGHYVVVDHIKDGKYHMWDPGSRSYNGYYTGDGLWHEILNYKGRGDPRYAYFYFEKK
jgi:hypothetical protein